MAQGMRASPRTAGTLTCSLPWPNGSILVSTLPRYLPKKRGGGMALPSSSHAHQRHQGSAVMPADGEFLRVAAAGDEVAHAAHQPGAVKGEAGAAQINLCARPQHAVVAQRVERSGGGQAVVNGAVEMPLRAAEGLRDR